MGDMADDAEYRALIQEAELEAAFKKNRKKAKAMKFHYFAGTLLWKQKDGTKILVSDMTDEHIINTVNMIKSKPEWYQMPTTKMWVKLLTTELLKRQLRANR